jgi:hypothetical protein
VTEDSQKKAKDAEAVHRALFPRGVPTSNGDLELSFELYQIMVKSSEDLVARRQGVNSFFVTINGALLTAIGLIVGSQVNDLFRALGISVLAATGVILSLAWISRIKSFGQLNTGKFAVISRLELLFPVAIYDAEWVALGSGKDPKKYRTFTSREIGPPWTFFGVYVLALVAMLLYAGHLLGWIFP